MPDKNGEGMRQYVCTALLKYNNYTVAYVYSVMLYKWSPDINI